MASGTNRSGIASLTMQKDGNLVIYGTDGRPAWATGTQGNPGAFLEVTGKDAVIRAPTGGAVLWSAARQGNRVSYGQKPAAYAAPYRAQSTLSNRIGFGAERVGVTTVIRPVQSVREVQEALNALGASPPLLVDGRMGRKTVAAIKVFQVTHGMLADGFAGPKTLTAMTISVAENERPFQSADFGLTLFTLFGGDELPGIGGRAEFGRAAARRSSGHRSAPRHSGGGHVNARPSGGAAPNSGRPAPPTGQMVNGQFVPTAYGASLKGGAGGGPGDAGHHHHHHHKKDQDQGQQPPPDASGGGPSGGGDSGGGGGAGDAGGGGGAPPPPDVPMDVSSAPVDDGSGGVSDATDVLVGRFRQRARRGRGRSAGSVEAPEFPAPAARESTVESSLAVLTR